MTPFSRRIAAATALLAALAFVAVATPRPAEAQQQPYRSQLDALSEEFIQRWLLNRPHLASRLGQRARDGELVAVTQGMLDAERAWLADFGQRLSAWRQATEGSNLSPARRAESRLLAALVERGQFELDVRRPYETDPSAYRPLIEGSIRVLLERRAGPICGRLRTIGRRLSRVPEVLRAAQINLREPSRVTTLAAIEGLDRTLALYRVELPKRGRSCRDATGMAQLAEADTLAVGAADLFRSWLRDDLLPRSQAPPAMGRGAFAQWLQAFARESAPLDSVSVRMEWEREASRRRVVELAARLAPGVDPRELIERLDAPVRGDTVRAAIVSAALDSAVMFVKAKRLVSMSGDPPVARVALPGAVAAGAVELDAPGIEDTGTQETELDVAPNATRGAGRAMLVFAALKEGVPGRHLMEVSRRRQSPLRATFPSPEAMRGWSEYAAGVALEQGFAAWDDSLRLVAEAWRLRRLGRLTAAFDIHVDGISVEAAARELEKNCLLDPSEALREAEAAAVDPESALDVLAAYRLAEFRDTVRRRLGDKKFDLGEFHDAVLAEGPLPLSIARNNILRRLGAREDQEPDQSP